MTCKTSHRYAHLALLFVVTVCSGLIVSLSAQAGNWTNDAGDNAWNNPENWSSGNVPDDGTPAVINRSGEDRAVLKTSGDTKTLRVGQGNGYQALPNANPWPFVAASISGKGHRVVLKQDAEDLGKPDAPIVVGFQKFAEEPARNITLINRTDQPVILRDSAKNCTVKSKAPVEDRGKNNEVSRLEE